MRNHSKANASGVRRYDRLTNSAVRAYSSEFPIKTPRARSASRTWGRIAAVSVFSGPRNSRVRLALKPAAGRWFQGAVEVDLSRVQATDLCDWLYSELALRHPGE